MGASILAMTKPHISSFFFSSSHRVRPCQLLVHQISPVLHPASALTVPFKTWTRGRRLASQSSASSASLEIAPEALVDEEKLPGYKPEHFYPATPGELLNARYRLEAKIGWGSSSTVWLAHDNRSGGWRQPDRYVAIKICNGNTTEEDDLHELDINQHLSLPRSGCRGHGVLATAVESFRIESPKKSNHLALVFKPLREPAWLFTRRITDGQDYMDVKALPVAKVYIKILLEGLNYMHTQAHVIHTDLKLDNIMFTFEDESTIQRFVDAQLSNPMRYKRLGSSGQAIYQCHNNFGPIMKRLRKMIPQLTDFGLSQRGDKDRRLIHPIQPDEYHAPEVLLGLGWSYSVDMWNFGALIWEWLSGNSLFRHSATPHYSAAQHLADMIALIGPVPPSIIQREKEMRHWRWSPEIMSPQNKLSSSAAEYYGGPFFNQDGSFVRKDLIPFSRNLRNELPQCIREENRAGLFLEFMRKMLCWVPEDRASAATLLNDPWLLSN